MALDRQLADIQDQLHSVEIMLAQKHEPGRHDQKRHGRVTVVRAGAKLPAGEYDSEGVGWTRSEAEKLMNKLAGAKDYKAANDKGWFTVKVEGVYHVINTKKGTEPVIEEPPAAVAPKKRPAKKQATPAPEPVDTTPGIFKAAKMGGNGSPAQKAEAARILNLLPKEHADRIAAVQVMMGRSVGFARAQGVANQERKMIQVAGGSQKSSGVYLRTTIAHEAGHLVLASADVRRFGAAPGGEVARAKLDKLYVDHKRNGTLFTDYAKRAPHEYAAEVYGYYVVHPDTLRQKDPVAYTVMKEFFNGQEYEEQ